MRAAIDGPHRVSSVSDVVVDSPVIPAPAPIPRWARLWLLSPDLVAPAVMVFGSVAVLGALVRLPGVVALVVSVVAMVATTVFLAGRLPTPSNVSVSDRVLVGAVWLGVVVWIIFCCRTAGEWFLVERDPGFYATTAKWFATHNEFPIQNGTADITNAIRGLTSTGYGYYDAGPGQEFSQGGPLLPVMLGHLQRILGPSGLPWGNVIFAGLGLVAFFAWARRIVPGWWALLAPATCALALPVLYMARSTFSESVALLLCVGGFALLTDGFVRASPRLIALGSLTAATATLDRPDGVAVGGLVVVAATGIWLLTTDRDPGLARRVTMAAVAPAVLMPLVSLVIYAVVTPGYLLHLKWEVGSEVLVLLAAAFVVVLLGHRLSWVRGRWSDLVDHNRGLVARGTALFSLAALVFLTMRPLWTKVHVELDLKNGYQQEVAGVQRMNDQVVDPSRTYDELTTVSTSWYFGWVVLVLAGLALLVFALTKGPGVHSRFREPWAVVIATLLVLIPLYFWAWHITQDQLWASRHLVMMGYPVLVLLASYAAYRITDSVRFGSHDSALRGAVALALVGSFVIPTVRATSPLATAIQYGGMSPILTQTCAAIDALAQGKTRVFALFTGPLAGAFQTPVGVWCDIPAVRIDESTGRTAFATTVALRTWADANSWTMLKVDSTAIMGEALPPGALTSRTTVSAAGIHTVSGIVTMYWRSLDAAPTTSFTKRYVVTVAAVGSGR